MQIMARGEGDFLTQLMQSLLELMQRFLVTSTRGLVERGEFREIIADFEKQKSSFVNAVSLKSHTFSKNEEQ